MRNLFRWFTAKKQTDHWEIDVEGFLEQFDEKAGHRILDVRTDNEIGKDKISESQIEIDLFRPDFTELIQQLQKDKTYFIYCRSGSRSVTACKVMSELGFSSVYSVKGGMTKWRSAHGPRKL